MVTLDVSKSKAWWNTWTWRHRMLNGHLSRRVRESQAYHDVLFFVRVNGTFLIKYPVTAGRDLTMIWSQLILINHNADISICRQEARKLVINYVEEIWDFLLLLYQFYSKFTRFNATLRRGKGRIQYTLPDQGASTVFVQQYKWQDMTT